MRKIREVLLFAFTLFCSGFIFGQEGDYTIKWLANERLSFEVDNEKHFIERLNFEGAVYSSFGLPEYSKTFELSDDDYTYKINGLTYEPVPDSLLVNIDTAFNIAEGNPHANVFASGRNKSYLDIRIQTLRKNPSTNKLERLVKFTIRSDKKTAGENITMASSSPENSLLSTGFWYKIKVRNTGIYKLSYSDLLDMGLSNPSRVRLFGHGGEQLSYWNSDPRPVDMTEIPIYINRGADDIFNQGDFILFYAQGPVTSVFDSTTNSFKQQIHGYSGHIFYFITDSHGAATEISNVDYSSLIKTHTTSTYNDFAYYEREWVNVLGSGRSWYSKRIDGTAYDTTFSFPNINPNDTVKIEAVMMGRNKNNRTIEMSVNDDLVATGNIDKVNFGTGSYLHGKNAKLSAKFTSSLTDFNIMLQYNSGDQTDEAYIDYIRINTRCKLQLDNKSLFFRNASSAGAGNVTEYNISKANANLKVWDVTDINDIKVLNGTLNGSNYRFQAPSDQIRDYVALDISSDFPKPITDQSIDGVGEVQNQNLRGLPVFDYIIIAPEVFINAAERLAEYHRTKNNLNVLVVDQQTIFNEFSSGTPDVSAIRDFIRHNYMKGDDTDSLKYVLLFGDGSYINHVNTESNTNYILTYQSAESLTETQSYTSDDFFGLLDEGEGEAVGKLDIGLGRFPVKYYTKGGDYEAQAAVDKVISYDASNFSDWRRRICFVADDQRDPGGNDGETYHMRDSDELADYVRSNYEGFDVRKVYLDAYPQVITAAGEAYPDVNQELDNLFEKGLLAFIYSGHGSENQITGELILQKSDLQSMTNSDVLPLFITATCQFSRYDHVETSETNLYDITAHTSAGEEAFLNPDGGAIALLTTSRLVYGPPNKVLVKSVLSHLFKKNSDGQPYSLGEVIRLAKNEQNNTNKLNFVLLGDPAMKLNYPRHKVFTDSVNHKAISTEVDTLKAFGLVTISGHVADDNGEVMSDFNGYVYPYVYDKEQEVETFGNDNQTKFKYTDQKNLLYRGMASVENGYFTFSFVVPKDISYNVGSGLLSYYAENGQIDAKGESKDFYIGGTSDNVIEDNYGPSIDLFMNDANFHDGGMTNANPHIYAEVFDENGINTTGIGIGHDIVAVLDDKYEKPYVLNDYYDAAADDFTRGIISYQLSGLEDGFHTLELKVWDVFNNSSETSIGFVVQSSDDFILEKVYNYPNPAQSYTIFEYTHNVPDEVHEIQLDVFDFSGRVVASLKRSNYESGFVSEPINWDLGSIVSAGVYPYQLKVITSKGTSYINQKLIIIR